MKMRVCAVALIVATSVLALSGCNVEPWRPDINASGAPMDARQFGTPVDGKFDVAPRLVEGQAPIYPFAEGLNGQLGSAVISFVVGEDGHTHDIKVVEASNRFFGGHLAYAAKSWIFVPAQKDGKPVSSTGRQVYCFGDWKDPEALAALSASAAPANAASAPKPVASIAECRKTYGEQG